MDPLLATPTPRVIREEQLAALSAPARRIAEVILELSKATWASIWHAHAEHRIWRALHEEGRDRAALRLDAADCAELRYLADEAGGWVAWTSGPTLIDMPAWLVLHRAWLARHPA